MEVACAVDNHVLDAVTLSIEGAVVLEGGVQTDGSMSIYFSLIINVGSQHTVDGNLMSLVNHCSKPLYIGHAAQLVEAVSIGCDVVLHKLSADRAPSVDIIMLGSRRVVGIAISHFT